MARPEKFDIEKDRLVELYVTKRLSQLECAKELGMPQQTVGLYLKRYGIETRPAFRRAVVTVDKEELRRLYCDEKLTMKDVAARLGCSYSATRAAIIAAGLEPGGKGVRRVYKTYKQFPMKTTDKGYLYESVPGHPSAKKKGNYLASHRLIVEKVIGRYLTADEHVHHINVQQQDNRIENFAVLNSSDHARIHKYMCHVAAFLIGLTMVKPGPLVFSGEVFWGGKYVTQIDLIPAEPRLSFAEYDSMFAGASNAPAVN